MSRTSLLAALIIIGVLILMAQAYIIFRKPMPCEPQAAYTPPPSSYEGGLVVGESYKFDDNDAVYYYADDHRLHRVATGDAYFRIYNCPAKRFDMCHTVQRMPWNMTKDSPILNGSVIER